MMAYGATAVVTGLALSLVGCGTGGTPATSSAPPLPPSPSPDAGAALPCMKSAIQANTIQFREHPDKCIEMVDVNASLGSPVHLAECRDQASQQSWYFDKSSSMIRSAVDSSKCLDISGANMEIGTLLQIWDCYDENVQSWVYDEDPGRIYHCTDADCSDTFCVDVPQNVIGSQIQIWNCDGKPVQSWSLGPSSCPPGSIPAPPPTPPAPDVTEAPPSAIDMSIRYRNDLQRCLDVSDGGGRQVQRQFGVWDCDTNRNQAFAFNDADATIKSAVDDSLCLTVASFFEGAALSLETCSGLEGQSWGYDDEAGRIFCCPDGNCDSAWCVNLEADAMVIVSSCNGMKVQEWKIESVGSSLVI